METFREEERLIVQQGKFLVWKHFADLSEDDLVCFYDGDLRKVLEPDDERLKNS